MTKTKNMSISPLRVAPGYNISTSCVLNIRNSDFGLLPAAAGEFRISNFVFRIFYVFSLLIGRIYPYPPPEAVGLITTKKYSLHNAKGYITDVLVLIQGGFFICNVLGLHQPFPSRDF